MIALNSASSSANDVSIRQWISGCARTDLATHLDAVAVGQANVEHARRRDASAGCARGLLGGSGFTDDLEVGLPARAAPAGRAERSRGRRAGRRESASPAILPLAARVRSRAVRCAAWPASTRDPGACASCSDAVLAVGSDLDLDAVLQRIIESAVALVDARYGALGVLDEAGTGLARVHHGRDRRRDARRDRATSRRASGSSAPHRRRPAAAARRHQRASRQRRVPAEPSADAQLPRRPDPRARPRSSATSTSPTRRRAEVFTDIDEELVLGLAAAAGVAINNAALFEDRRRARSSSVPVCRKSRPHCSPAPTPQTILEVVADRARELVEARPRDDRAARTQRPTR